MHIEDFHTVTVKMLINLEEWRQEKIRQEGILSTTEDKTKQRKQKTGNFCTIEDKKINERKSFQERYTFYKVNLQISPLPHEIWRAYWTVGEDPGRPLSTAAGKAITT